MSPLKDRIKALSEMGHFFRHISEKDCTYTPLFNAIDQAQTQNGWFQKTACLLALKAWGETLRLERIEKWLLPYGYEEQKNPKTIAVIMAGNINRPSLTDLSFDLQTFKLAKNLLLNKTGDNSLLVSIKKYFMENGFDYFNWKKHCPELFANKENLTFIKPSHKAKKNLKKALSIFKSFGEIDVGQSMIIQNQIVLGLEAVEGTDKLIKRCKDYKKSGDKGVLVKFSKYNQSDILDIPTIGEKTIKLLKDNDYEGIYLEKDSCLIIDKEKTIDLANQYELFIFACNKIE